MLKSGTPLETKFASGGEATGGVHCPPKAAAPAACTGASTEGTAEVPLEPVLVLTLVRALPPAVRGQFVANGWLHIKRNCKRTCFSYSKTMDEPGWMEVHSPLPMPLPSTDRVLVQKPWRRMFSEPGCQVISMALREMHPRCDPSGSHASKSCVCWKRPTARVKLPGDFSVTVGIPGANSNRRNSGGKASMFAPPAPTTSK
mmetsp:Transcript_46302/g.148695  ORF Transcript_46302/g.148695 Transcript_46302/m.148695 type:complete len:201 (-) Transcript_46302:1486-2088(-)